MNPMPVVIYGFDNRPRFYDFIVVDAEEQAAGTITVYARRAATTSIRSISSNVKDYRSALSKAGSLSASFFEDWQERSFVGIRGKTGDLPVIDVTTAANIEQLHSGMAGFTLTTKLIVLDLRFRYSASLVLLI